MLLLLSLITLTVILGAAAADIMMTQPGETISSTTTNTSTSATSSSTSTSTSSSHSSSANGLQTRLELNRSSLVPGAVLGITVGDYNPTSAAVNVSKDSAWAMDGLSTGGCPSLYYPFGIAILQGRYTTANISQAMPLRVFPNVACPLLVRYITGYLFQAMSYNATVIPGTGAVPMQTAISVGGTYGTAGSLQQQLTPFAPGTYTVVAGDEWGNLTFAYFYVLSPS